MYRRAKVLDIESDNGQSSEISHCVFVFPLGNASCIGGSHLLGSFHKQNSRYREWLPFAGVVSEAKW